MVEKIDLRAVMKGVVVFVGLFIAYFLIGLAFTQLGSSLGTKNPMVSGVIAFSNRLLWIASIMVPGWVAGRAAGKSFFLHGALVGVIGGAFSVFLLFLGSLAIGTRSPFDSMLPLSLLITAFLCGFGGLVGEHRGKPADPSDAKEQEALYRAGLALYNQAQTKTGEEAQALYQAACEKYSAALAIKPNNAKIINDWGAALLEQAHSKTPEEGEALYAQAEEKFLAAEELQPGIASYNLACIHSVRGEYEECQKRLGSARDHKTLPSPDHIEQDPDLDNVRRLEWFQEFMKTLPTTSKSG